ncbi:hypothetical protein D3C73_993940 [compost metagenome]
MHIVAATVRTLPLHQHMDWKDTVVQHVSAINGKVYAISGKASVYLIESDYLEEKPQKITVIYEGGAPVSCVDTAERNLAVLTTDGYIILIGLDSGSVSTRLAVPSGLELMKLHFALDESKLLTSGHDGAVHVCDTGSGIFSTLPNIRVDHRDGELVKLSNNRILLSANNDEMMIYDRTLMLAEILPVRVPSIRGRAFKATITGGALLEDGTVVAGTYDGMLFTLSPDLRKTTVYGRLHSTGLLRNFIKRNDEEVVGIYGGSKDAGHVFHFSRDRGFVDLGRPRVIKDNIELRDMDTEWACIHYISSLAYDPDNDCLCVASGEGYGCVVRYQGVAFPC